jgi:hypothetical protein
LRNLFFGHKPYPQEIKSQKGKKIYCDAIEVLQLGVSIYKLITPSEVHQIDQE